MAWATAEYVDHAFTGKLKNIFVDVACKFEILEFGYVDNELKLSNIVLMQIVYLRYLKFNSLKGCLNLQLLPDPVYYQ